MKYILTTSVAMLMALTAFSPRSAEMRYLPAGRHGAKAMQNESGIFLLVKCARGSVKQTSLINHKQVCLAPSPIILPSEFVSVTDVQTLSDKVWFDLVFSPKAVKLISQLAANLPSANFALVVDKDVFTTFPANQLTANRTFRFQGNAKEQSTFFDIQKKLKSMIAVPAQ